jgi:hypothetical protein
MKHVPEEVPANDLDDIPGDEDVDVFVADIVKTDGARKLVDETDKVDHDS